MGNLKFDDRALTEVNEIISMLDGEALNKIPQRIIRCIRDNMNNEYEVDLSNIESCMLPDTTRILASLYTYYLADDNEQETIFQMIKLEKQKEQTGASKCYDLTGRDLAYNQQNEYCAEQDKGTAEVEQHKDLIEINNNFFTRILNQIKSWLRKKDSKKEDA